MKSLRGVHQENSRFITKSLICQIVIKYDEEINSWICIDWKSIQGDQVQGRIYKCVDQQRRYGEQC